jgi:hypothetical protein
MAHGTRNPIPTRYFSSYVVRVMDRAPHEDSDILSNTRPKLPLGIPPPLCTTQEKEELPAADRILGAPWFVRFVCAVTRASLVQPTGHESVTVSSIGYSPILYLLSSLMLGTVDKASPLLCLTGKSSPDDSLFPNCLCTSISPLLVLIPQD